MNTWLSSGENKDFWPDWLYDDLTDDVAIWSVGYPARGTNWRSGNSLALPDRARNLLPRLLAEPDLQQGNIVFVAHSLGGLVAKQIIQVAESESRHQAEAAHFVSRVRGVAFIGTPHQGSRLATFLNRWKFLRPSTALLGLGMNDPHLRELNIWFRNFSPGRLRAVVLQETKALGGFFSVVTQDSSDPGLEPSTLVIPIDEDHLSIVKPKDRNSDTYIHLRKFLSGDFTPKSVAIVTQNELADIKTIIEANVTTAHKILEAVRSPPPPRPVGSFSLVEGVARSSILRQRQRRFFEESRSQEEIMLLAANLQTGEFSLASPQTRCNGLSWCSRMLVGLFLSAEPELSSKRDGLIYEARRLHNEAAQLAYGDELVIAEAFLAIAESDAQKSLSLLAPLDSATAQTARFLVATSGKSAAAALDWLNTAQVAFADLDADGKLIFIGRHLDNSGWDAALGAVGMLSDEDFKQTPALLLHAAACHLLQAVPEQLRDQIAEHSPFDWVGFPLATVGSALEHRRMAREFYVRAQHAAFDLECPLTADHSRERALWLDLRDPERHSEGKKVLIELLGSDQSLRYVPIALQFEIPLDRGAVNKEIARQEALGAAKAYDVLLARFSLIMASRNPSEVADFVSKHRKELHRYFSAAVVIGMEVDALARSDQLLEAESRLQNFTNSGADQQTVNSLAALIADARGVDTISDREANYEKFGRFEDLVSLVGHLDAKMDWQRLATRSLELFEQTQGLQDALRHVKALSRLHADAALLSFLATYPQLQEQSAEIAGAKGWALFRRGSLNDAQTILTGLQKLRKDPNDRALQFNVCITGGQWEALAPLLDTEWIERDERSALDLLQAGQLAGRFALPRSQEFIRAAAEKGHHDPGVLLGCYGAALKGSWENDPKVASWLMTAASMSGEDGPVATISLQDLVSRKPDWDNEESEVTRQFISGELPMFALTKLLNRPLIALTLYTATMNLEERDPRQRGMIFAYSGTRTKRSIKPSSVAIDITAFYTLGFLDLIERLLSNVGKVYIPHSTLTWMAQDGEEGLFHQPSRVADAKRLRQHLAEGRLRKLEKTTQAEPQLSRLVGDELATLITHASASVSEDGPQKLVVRPYPVHRVGSLLKDPADMTTHAALICACGDLVQFLKGNGYLTIGDAEKAAAYLDAHEQRWPHKVQIDPGATLYLDPLAERYFSLLNLIGPLSTAGFSLVVPESVVNEANALISYANYSESVMSIHEHVRKSLAKGIYEGQILLGPVVDEREDDPSWVGSHPSATILSLPPDVDAYVIDDRFMNEYMDVENIGTRRPLMTSLDLIDMLAEMKAISAAESLELRTKLRRAGYALVPIEKDELKIALEAATVSDGVLIETAELKAIRESVLRIKMSQSFQFPKEAAWIEQLSKNAIAVLHSQWQVNLPDDLARARSNWLITLSSLSGWEHRLQNPDTTKEHGQPDVAQAWSLLGVQILEKATMKRFLAWADERVFIPIREADPVNFFRITEHIKILITQISNAESSTESRT